MRRTLRTLSLVTIPLVVGCTDSTGPAPITELPRELTTTERQVVGASNVFALDLLRESVARNPRSPNVFLSPLSASMALGMTMNGADGETWSQMRDALGLDGLDEPEINEGYRSLTSLLLDLDPSVTVGIGNSIWTREGYPVLPDFYDRARTYFDAAVQELDFTDPGAADQINAWVEDATRGRITDMVGTIPGNVVMYLLNAVYFKGDWTSAFDPGRTRMAPFSLADGGTVTVPMMEQRGEFRTFETGSARGIELPYGGGAFTAVAVRPAGGTDLTGLLEDVDRAVWAEWMALLDMGSTSEVDLGLPRFELEYEEVLNETLQALGMTDAFGGAADFSRLVEGGGVWIDEVKQKSFLKVDEEGTEAAAATSVAVVESASPQFRFDAPFLFAIRERISGTLLFIGFIGDPSA